MTDRRKALAVAAVLFLAFNSNCRAIGTRDTLVVELTALSLASSYDVDLSEFEESQFFSLASGEYVGRDFRVLPAYPVVPALMAAPVFGGAVAAGVLDPANPAPEIRGAVGKLSASLFTAAACGLLYGLIRRHAPTAPAALVVIGAALASPYWSTASQALWGHAAAALLLAFAVTVGGRGQTSAIQGFAAGAAIALAVATRALLMPFALGLAFAAWRSKTLLWTAAGMGLAIGALETWHLATYGSLLGGAALLESDAIHQEVHMVQSAWTTDVVGNAAGIWFSANRGMLIYMPVAAFALVGGWRLWRTDPAARCTFVAPTLAYFAGWSAYSVWWGGHSYGPRYATDVVIPLAVMVAAAFFWRRTPGIVLKTVGSVALAWSITVQAVGVYCYPNGNWNALPVDVDLAHARLWEWRDTQIVRTIQGGLYTDHLSKIRAALRTKAEAP